MKGLAVQQERFVEDKLLRDMHVGRVDVLNKVGNIIYLPDDRHLTTQLVAEYYKVNAEVIRQIVVRHRDELDSDGMKTLKRTEILAKIFASDIKSLSKFISSKARIVTLFPRRAVLRIGMLLRDSEVAKEIRTYLLNVEENVATEHRKRSINEWTNKEELILLDSIYSIVNNGGTLTKALELASEKLGRTVVACRNRYTNRIRDIISDEAILKKIANNKGRHLRLVYDKDSNEVNTGSNKSILEELNSIKSYIDRSEGKVIKLLEDKISKLEEENKRLDNRNKSLSKRYKSVSEELKSTQAVIAASVKIEVEDEIKNTFKMDRNGNLERV